MSLKLSCNLIPSFPGNRESSSMPRLLDTGLRRHNVKKQKGVTLVGALFIIVVMALLGTGLLQLMTTSQQSIGQEITSVKAYFAGHSALQWGLYQATYAAATGTHTISFNQQGLTNTTAIATLTSSNIEGSSYYLINADARYGINTDREYSQRQLRLRYRP